MNKRQKAIRIFTALFILSFFSVFTAYLNYTNYTGADLPASKPRFENPDQYYLLADQEDEFQICGQNTFCIAAEPSLLEKFCFFSYETSSFHHKTVVRRC